MCSVPRSARRSTPFGPGAEEYAATGNLEGLSEAPPGRYRFVISSSEGEERATGEFELRF
jgi:hypothetical protein